MKQSKRLNDDLKSEHNQTTHDQVGPTKDIDS